MQSTIETKYAPLELDLWITVEGVICNNLMLHFQAVWEFSVDYNQSFAFSLFNGAVTFEPVLWLDVIGWYNIVLVQMALW